MAAIELVSTTLFNDANLVSYYKLENANDSKGSNTLTNNGTTGFAAAKFNNGAVLDVGTKFFSRADGLGVDLSAGYAVSLWVKITTEVSGADTYRIIHWQSTTGTGSQMYLDYRITGGNKTLRFSGATAEVASTQTLGTAIFHNIVATCTGAGAMTLYLDGVSLGTGSTGTGGATNTLGIGADDSGGTNPTPSILDDIAFFSRNLTATDVSLIFNGPSGGTLSLNTKRW